MSRSIWQTRSLINLDSGVLTMHAGGSPGASSAGSDTADAGKGRTRDNNPLDELQQEEVCPLLVSYTSHLIVSSFTSLPCKSGTDWPLYQYSPHPDVMRPGHGMQIAELNHRLKEVAVDLDQRIRQELAYPAVVHFYSWLLQGKFSVSVSSPLRSCSGKGDHHHSAASS